VPVATIARWKENKRRLASLGFNPGFVSVTGGDMSANESMSKRDSSTPPAEKEKGRGRERERERENALSSSSRRLAIDSVESAIFCLFSKPKSLNQTEMKISKTVATCIDADTGTGTDASAGRAQVPLYTTNLFRAFSEDFVTIEGRHFVRNRIDTSCGLWIYDRRQMRAWVNHKRFLEPEAFVSDSTMGMASVLDKWFESTLVEVDAPGTSQDRRVQIDARSLVVHALPYAELHRRSLQLNSGVILHRLDEIVEFHVPSVIYI
jgi:hypothetical protein